MISPETGYKLGSSHDRAVRGEIEWGEFERNLILAGWLPHDAKSEREKFEQRAALLPRQETKS